MYARLLAPLPKEPLLRPCLTLLQLLVRGRRGVAYGAESAAGVQLHRSYRYYVCSAYGENRVQDAGVMHLM